MGGFERNMLDYFCRVNHGSCLYTDSFFYVGNPVLFISFQRMQDITTTKDISDSQFSIGKFSKHFFLTIKANYFLFHCK